MKRLKAVLAILISHNIILWHQAHEADLPYYQVDWHATYVLVRQSRVARLVHSRHGEKAGGLFQNVMLSGTVKVEDLEKVYKPEPSSKRDSGIDPAQPHSSKNASMANGLTNVKGCYMDDSQDGHIITVASFHDTLRLLLENGFLMKVDADRDHEPPADLEDRLKYEIVSNNSKDFKDGKITGPKKVNQFATAANELKRKWQAEAEYSHSRDVASHGSIKRPNESMTNGNKRRKVNGDLPNGHHDGADEMSEDEDVKAGGPAVRKLPVCCSSPCLSLAWLIRCSA